MSIFKRLFGEKNKEKQGTSKEENVTFSAGTMSQSDLDKMKVGDVITLGNEKEAEVKYDSVWIEATENPFKIRIFDCREYALKMISTTQNSDVARQFIESRNSDGTEFIGKFPENGVKIEVNLNFDTEGKQLADGPVFKATTMEEKWDIYKYANFLFFVRSWTGELVYFTNYIPTQKGFKVDVIVVNDTKIDEEDPHFELKVVEFLIHSYVLGYPVPHPIPKVLEDHENIILNYSFSMFGNRGLYASYE